MHRWHGRHRRRPHSFPCGCLLLSSSRLHGTAVRGHGCHHVTCICRHQFCECCGALAALLLLLLLLVLLVLASGMVCTPALSLSVCIVPLPPVVTPAPAGIVCMGTWPCTNNCGTFCSETCDCPDVRDHQWHSPVPVLSRRRHVLQPAPHASSLPTPPTHHHPPTHPLPPPPATCACSAIGAPPRSRATSAARAWAPAAPSPALCPPTAASATGRKTTSGRRGSGRKIARGRRRCRRVGGAGRASRGMGRPSRHWQAARGPQGRGRLRAPRRPRQAPPAAPACSLRQACSAAAAASPAAALQRPVVVLQLRVAVVVAVTRSRPWARPCWACSQQRWRPPPLPLLRLLPVVVVALGRRVRCPTTRRQWAQRRRACGERGKALAAR